MGSHEELVAQIKALQRNDFDAKQQWIAYADAQGGGIRDPNKHEAEYIQNFLAQYESGARLPAPEPEVDTRKGGKGGGKGGGAKGGGGQAMAIAEYAMAQYDRGAQAYGGPQMGGPPMTDLDFTPFVKTLQRALPTFKGAWAEYCATSGGGRNDPAKHDSSFIISFFDDLCYRATAGGGGGAMMGGGMPMRGGMMGGGGMGGGMRALGGMGGHPMGGHMMEPPAKRMRMAAPQMGGGMGGMGGGGMHGPRGGMAGLSGGGGDAAKQGLVDTIKDFQRGGPEQKQQWWDYCDQELGGVRDPNRQDVTVLRGFCQMYGLGGGGKGSAGGKGKPAGGGCGGMGGGMGGGMAAAGGASDPAKQSLVDRVKAFQKQGPEQKETWYSFCGPVKDPNRHDASSLEEFCNMYGLADGA